MEAEAMAGHTLMADSARRLRVRRAIGLFTGESEAMEKVIIVRCGAADAADQRVFQVYRFVSLGRVYPRETARSCRYCKKICRPRPQNVEAEDACTQGLTYASVRCHKQTTDRRAGSPGAGRQTAGRQAHADEQSNKARP